MNSLLAFIEKNKIFSISLPLVIILCAILYFVFHIEDKAPMPTPTVIRNVEPIPIELEESDDFKELIPVQKVQDVEKEVKEELFVLSSTSIGIYTISLNSTYEIKDINQTDTLYCFLKLSNYYLPFELAIDKELLNSIDDLFIKVTTNENHFVVEDAYILKELKEDVNYALTLLLYDDYVSLSLDELDKKSEKEPSKSNSFKPKLNLQDSKFQKMPDKMLADPSRMIFN